MPQVALHTILAAGNELKYDAVHKVIPPGLAIALREHGVRDWQIWRDGRDVFHVVDVEDYRAMRDGLRDHPVNVAWQKTIGPLCDRPDRYDGDVNGISFVWSLAGQSADGDNSWR